MDKKLLITLLIAFSFIPPALCQAAGIKLAWRVHDEQQLVAGYNVYYGEAGTPYTARPARVIHDPSQPSCAVTDLDKGRTYGFRVSTFSAQGVESLLSDELLYTVATTKTLDVDRLYFPHVETRGDWETGAAIINTGTKTLNGVLLGCAADGSVVDSLQIILPPGGRTEVNVSQTFSDADSIRYLVLYHKADGLCGYTWFSRAGKCRGALPASNPSVSANLPVPHIASDQTWWTGLGLINTTSEPRGLVLSFSDGRTRALTIPPDGHSSFFVQDLFNGTNQPGISSLEDKGAQGVVGLELFGSDNLLSGIRLSADAATTLAFPHLHSDSKWWTGLVVYNPSAAATNMTITSFSADGTALSSKDTVLPGGEKYIGLVRDLSLPEGTAWLRIQASRPVTGFQLFGTTSGKLLGGFTNTNLLRSSGVFPKLEQQGWTGIALVNTTSDPLTLTLKARDNTGAAVAAATLSLDPYAKALGMAEELFAGQDISRATYLTFEATGPIAGFQLNGADNGWLLDGLPCM